MKLLLAPTFLLGLLASEAIADPQDWPFWRGAERDGRVTGFTAPRAWPKELVRQWCVPVGLGDATPALVANRVFIFGRQDNQEITRCLAAEDGAEIWQNAYAAVAVTGAAEKYAGPRSSPAVGGGKVVTLGVGGVLTCLDTVSGKVIWRHEALVKEVPRFFTATSPLIVDDLCVVHLGGPEHGVLFALELANGRPRWRWEGEGPAYASPVVTSAQGVRQVVLQTESSISGISLTEGRRLWRVPTSPKPGYWNSATPVVDGPKVYFSGQGTGTRALQIEAADGGFAARECWHNAEVGTVYNTPVLRNGSLFGLSPRGQFFCLDAATGETRWVVNDRVSNFGAIVDAGTVLATLPEKSGLIFYRPSQARFEEVARYQVSETPIYAHPVIAGRRIFVRDRDTVALWVLSGE